MKYLFIFISLIYFSESWGNCSSSDLNEGGPFKHMPIYDQDGTGLCYAYAASQLISYELRINNPSTTLDPSPLALSADASGFFDRSLDGGKIRKMIASAKSSGIRKYTCVKEQAARFGTTEAFYTKTVHKIAELHSKFEWFRKPSRDEVLQNIKSYPDIPSRFCNVSQIYDDLSSHDLLNTSAPDILKKFISPCPVNPLPDLDYKEFNKGSDDEIAGNINNILDQKRPVGVNFCYNIFELPGYYPPPVRGSILPRERSLTINPCDSHAALITAKRADSNNECEYLIRNSWGAYWKPEGFSCACKINGAYFADCPSYEDLLKKYPDNVKHSIADFYESRIYVGCWIKKGQLAPTIMSVGSII